jgi:hypothetical protein
VARRRRRRNPGSDSIPWIVGGVVVLGVGFVIYQQMQATNALLAQNNQGTAPTDTSGGGGSSTAVGNTINDVGTGVQTGLNLLNNASA